MKKIVDGRLYDTCEATTVVTWTEHGSACGVEFEVRCALHRKRVLKGSPEDALAKLKLTDWGGVSAYEVEVDESKGEFFLSKEIGTSSVGTIKPLDDGEAKRVFEAHNPCDYDAEGAYQKWFGVHPSVDDQLAVLKKAFTAGRDAQVARQAEEDRKKAEEAAKAL